MSTFQKDTFLSTEGDGWYRRNHTALSKKTDFSAIDFYLRYMKSGQRVLEIGCSYGANLHYMQKNLDCVCHGIDPSVEAIDNGSKQYPDMKLSVGTADHLDFPDEYFDFVLFGFCLCLVDRSLLTKVVAEADRVLKNEGFLGISDFDVKLPQFRQWKHVEGIMCYKMDYSQIFLALPHYSLADKYCFSHSGNIFTEDINERLSSVVLFKNHANAYSNPTS